MQMMNTIIKLFRASRIHKSHRLVKPERYQSLTIELPTFDSVYDEVVLCTITPDNVMDLDTAMFKAPRRPLVRPERFRNLTVIVPTDIEKEDSPDLPDMAFKVYPDLPNESVWGALENMALKRLQHVRMVDHIAYKVSVAKGIKTPVPPRLRA